MKTARLLPEVTDTTTDICFWELDLYTGNLFWSDGLCKLLDLRKPFTPTLEQLISYYQPEKNIRQIFNRAIHQGIAFGLELSASISNQKPVSVYTIGQPVYDDYGKCIAVKGVLSTAEEQNSAKKNAAFTIENNQDQHLMIENFAKIISHNLRSHTSNLQMVVDAMQQNHSEKEILELIVSIKSISKNLNQTVGYLNTLIKI